MCNSKYVCCRTPKRNLYVKIQEYKVTHNLKRPNKLAVHRSSFMQFWATIRGGVSPVVLSCVLETEALSTNVNAARHLKTYHTNTKQSKTPTQ